MSQELTNRNSDLKKLRDEGYAFEIRDPYLIVYDIPHVDANAQVQIGTMVCQMVIAGDTPVRPVDHTVHFGGARPCDRCGNPLTGLVHSDVSTMIAGVPVKFYFSSKPQRGHYLDTYEKITTYVKILSHPAQSIDPSATAQTFRPIETEAGESVFNYVDTASSRAGIEAVSRKLEIGSVAFVGLGGTGSYALDPVAKCPVGAIHLFDGDRFYNHNAFRTPGAPSIEELRSMPMKVDYLHGIYSRMHRNIVPHPYYISAFNVAELRDMHFVFLCLDRPDDKEVILQSLQEWQIPFIDVGIGLKVVDDRITGIVRATTSSAHMSRHIWDKHRIPLGNAAIPNEYASAIQVADLNALNAMLAVIRWKKMCGFYADMEGEHHCQYIVNNNQLHSEDRADGG